MKKMVVFNECGWCPYYDNSYYHYMNECTLLEETIKGEIPVNCPLKSTSEPLTESVLGTSFVTK